VAVTLWLGRNLWFCNDECDFLRRNLGSLTDLLRPHNEHWVTTAFLAYGSLKLLVGTASYMPYLLLLAATHVFMAAGVYQLVAPRSRWFAIFCFTLLFFLGSGEENQLWAFQVGFVIASGFGAWALVMADRRRPLAAALLLVASTASSNAWYAAYGHTATLINNPLTPEQLTLLPGYLLGSVAGALTANPAAG
jgi:hypothetical protein